MNKMEACEAAKRFSGQLAALAAGGNVNLLLTPENLVIGERDISLRNTLITNPGAPVGVYPGFSAPEVYAGQAGMASGVYFVGAVLYMLLKGTPPPDAQSRNGRPAFENPADPLEQLVNQMLEPNPAGRIGNFAALQNALGSVEGQLRAAQPTPQGAAVPPPPVMAQPAPPRPAAPPVQQAAPPAPGAVPPPSSAAAQQAAPPPAAPAGAQAPGSVPPAPGRPQPMAGPGPMPPQGMAPQGMPPQGMPPQGMAPQGMPPQGMPPQGMQPQGMAPQGMPPQGMQPRPGMPPPPPGAPKPKKKRTGLKVAIISCCIVLVLGGAFLAYTLVQQNRAKTAYEEGNYADYISAMDMTPWIKGGEGSEEQLRYSYGSARLLEEEGSLDEALEAYDALASFEDSGERANSIRYDMAMGLLDEGDLKGSLDLFKALGRYQDSQTMVYDIEDYMAADAMTDPVDRYNAFTALGDFLDSEDQAYDAVRGVYDQAVALYLESDFYGAEDLFYMIYDFSNSARYIEACEMGRTYYSANLPVLQQMESEGITIGHIVLSGDYWRGYQNGTWISDDGGGEYWYNSSQRRFGFDVIKIGEGDYQYNDNALNPLFSGGNLIKFEHVAFNHMIITVEGYGSYNFYKT